VYQKIKNINEFVPAIPAFRETADDLKALKRLVGS
jgi:hypothetical protein